MERATPTKQWHSSPAIPGLVSVVVVNWNGLRYLPECLDSVGAQDYSPLELHVIDNGSLDGSREWLREHRQGRMQLIEFEENRGFAAGANAGIRASRGEFVALLNNDATAEPAWISRMVAAAQDPAVGMVASKILFHDRRNVIDKTGHLFYPDGLNRGRGAGEIDRGQYDGTGEILFPDGCAALYRRRMLDEVGLFDEQFFAYGDDAELGLRARWQGWRCAYAPHARVYHRHSSSLGRYSPKKAFFVERNRLWVAVKTLPWPLLLASPVLTLWRFFWHARTVLPARGLAGGVAREHSAAGLLRATVLAYVSGIAGLPKLLRKRHRVFRTRRISSLEFYRLLRRYRIGARDLASRD